MCEGRRFQADGAATEKELFESWRLDRGTIKLPRFTVSVAREPGGLGLNPQEKHSQAVRLFMHSTHPP